MATPGASGTPRGGIARPLGQPQDGPTCVKLMIISRNKGQSWLTCYLSSANSWRRWITLLTTRFAFRGRVAWASRLSRVGYSPAALRRAIRYTSRAWNTSSARLRLEQARMTYAFVRMALEPTGEYRFIDSATRLGITHRESNTKLRAISSNGKTAFGLVNVPLAVIDEPGGLEIVGGPDACRTPCSRRRGR